MDRLLSENEITKIVGWPSAFEYAKIVELNKAQLAKTDKEWVEWVENNLMECSYHKEPFMCIPVINWEVRKKEINQ